MKIGEKLAKWEHGRLASAFRARKEVDAMHTLMKPAIMAIARVQADDIEDIYLGWTTSVMLKPGKKLKEEAWKAISDVFGEEAELKISPFDGTGYFEWTTGNRYMAYFKVTLSTGTCEVRKVSKIEVKRVKTVHYERIGECSGLEI